MNNHDLPEITKSQRFLVSHYKYFNLVKNPIENRKAKEVNFELEVIAEPNHYKACYSKPIVECFTSLSAVKRSGIGIREKTSCFEFEIDEQGDIKVTEKKEIISQLIKTLTEYNFAQDSLTQEGVSTINWLAKSTEALDYELFREVKLIYQNPLDYIPQGSSTVKYGDDEIDIQLNDKEELRIAETIIAEGMNSFTVEEAKMMSDMKVKYRLLSCIDIFGVAKSERPSHDEIIGKYLIDSLDILATKLITLNSDERTVDHDNKLVHILKAVSTESKQIIRKDRTEITRL